ncbi:TfoX/Sxy family protein [Silanimonas sp.]|uniref:TfoX/Sxy family protein n=1 Tax=Silanimonas sp. TaxID=1929290 RepID=UPI0022C65AAA|nr:TfoX/Sxy family protein [Silanimonas sp.]MCZ8116381.1 TfoX/Sxy family protein [Silanimonas sp.]
MAAPAKLRNIGPKSAAQLRQVGVRTLDDLRALGSLEAFVKLKRAGFKPSLNLLYSLEGALLDCHWQQVPEARRSELILAADAASATLPKAQPRWFSGGNAPAGAVAASDGEVDSEADDEPAEDGGSDGGGD